MPNPVVALGAVGVGTSLYGANQADKASNRAADATRDANNAAIGQQERALQSFENRVQPFADLRTQVQNPLLSALGLGPTQGMSRDDLIKQRESLQSTFDAGRRGNPLYQSTNITNQLADIDRALQSPNALSQGGVPPQIDLNALPAAPTAFNANDLNNPIISFLRDENFRAIKEAGAGGGRNVDRDLANYNAGLISTVAPQVQQQTFNQQTALRGNALAEQSGVRSDALNENQNRINNLLNVLGISQNAAVGAGNAGLNTANNIGSALTNIGAGNAQAAINKGNNTSNMLNNLVGIGGTLYGMRNPVGGSSMSGGGGFNALDPNLFNFSGRGLNG